MKKRYNTQIHASFTSREPIHFRYALASPTHRFRSSKTKYKITKVKFTLRKIYDHVLKMWVNDI